MQRLNFDATFLAARTDSYTIVRDLTDTLNLKIYVKIFTD